MRWPSDHIFVTEEFRSKKLEHLPKVGSDHFPIFVELVIETQLLKELQIDFGIITKASFVCENKLQWGLYLVFEVILASGSVKYNIKKSESSTCKIMFLSFAPCF